MYTASVKALYMASSVGCLQLVRDYKDSFDKLCMSSITVGKYSSHSQYGRYSVLIGSNSM